MNMNCRACGGHKLNLVFSLGNQHIVDYLDSKQAAGEKYPLNLYECADCRLVQLDYVFPREKLYRHYYYRSGTQERQVAWLRDLVQATVKRAGARKGHVWLDIGSNDSTLLNLVPNGWSKVGFEPATNLIPTKTVEQGGLIFPDFFTAQKFKSQFHEADVISACAMFYDLDQPHVFLDDIRQILAPDGLFVVQMNYLPSMLINNTYDNISHEHVCYYSLRSLENLLAAHNLQVVAVELNEVNGGSFRCYIQHSPTEPEMSVFNLRKYEEQTLTPSAWREFRDHVEESKMALTEFLTQTRKKGGTVWVYGASNRGQTILQYCGIGSNLVQACADRNPAKHGRKTVTGIPIQSEERMRTMKPNYLLILPYFYLPAFIQRENDYLDKGGQFLVPLPTVRLIGKQNGTLQTRIIK